MATALTICNQALIELGQQPIASLSGTDDTAVACNTLYADTLDETLLLSDWDFATTMQALTASTVPPAFKWAYQYVLPTNPWCLKVLFTSGGAAGTWEIGVSPGLGRVIYANTPALSIQYVARLDTDLTDWNATAIQILIRLLASKLAKAFTGQTALAEEKLKEALALVPPPPPPGTLPGGPHAVGLYAPVGAVRSDLEVMNQALLEIGAPTVRDFNEDTKQAHAVRAHFATARDATLEMHPWNFAHAFAVLTRLAHVPPFKWHYYFRLPIAPDPECLRVLGTHEGQRATWEVGLDLNGHKVFCSDQPSVGIEYTARVTDLSQWSDLAIQVFVKMLASRLVEPLGQQAQVGVNKFKEAGALLPEARRSDAQEGTPGALRPSTVLTAARIGRSFGGMTTELMGFPLLTTTPPTITFQDVVSLGDPTFGAVGDGVTNDSGALQRAVDAAIARRAALYVPSALVGYRLNTPIDLTDLDGSLLIVGHGIQAPTFGQALAIPHGGSLFLGNTGLGRCVFDCCGSNNIVFRDLNVTSLGQPNPSSIGFLFGTSTTSPPIQTPGGANYGLENVAITLQNANNSVPVYYVRGTGLSHFFNVWTLGVYGLFFTGSNTLNVTSTFVTIPGAIIGIDGVHCQGCNLLGYGGGSPLIVETSSNYVFDQLYVATILGGPSYAGQPYAITLNNVIAVDISVEEDYFPALLVTAGYVENCQIRGSVFSSTTPLVSNLPIVGFLGGTTISNCQFSVYPATVLTSHYMYIMHATTPTVTEVSGCSFFFNPNISNNVFFGNVTGSAAVPYFNLNFHGFQDGATIALLKNGVAPSASLYRYRVNGVLFGTG